MANGNWITVGMVGPYYAFPNDAESDDVAEIGDYIERLMTEKYPEPSLEVFSTFNKQYWLPALKVLDRKSHRFFSPQYTVEWVDGELRAICQEDEHVRIIHSLMNTVPEVERHIAPNESCDCGIYGSVNLEEITRYFLNRVPMRIDVTAQDFRQENKALCIIEPYPDAKTIICRKGWKTSHAFISEIVYETIGPREASQLLSMVWNRNIDVERIYENR